MIEFVEPQLALLLEIINQHNFTYNFGITCESKPVVNIIVKNSTAQTFGNGSLANASG